jgi:hypothetical protein
LIMGRQLNILIQVEKFWSYFAKSCDLCHPRIEAKDRTGEVLSSESESSDLKSPKSTFNWRPIVEISSTFIRKSIKEGKTFSLFYRLKFGNILIIIILQEIITQYILLQLLSLKSAGKIVILPDNRKLPYVAFCLLSQTIFSFYLE